MIEVANRAAACIVKGWSKLECCRLNVTFDVLHLLRGAPHDFANEMCSQKGGGKIELSMHEEGGSNKLMDEQALRQMSLEILTEIKEWRRAHPRATYVQIEDEVHKRLMQLEARL